MADNFKFRFNMVDSYGNTSAKNVEFRDYAGVTPDASLAQAITDAEAFAEALDQATKAQIVGVEVSFDLAGLFTGWVLKGAPIAGADITDIAEYALYADNPPYPGKTIPFSVPAPHDDLFINPTVSRLLDLGASQITNLVARFANTAGGEAQLSDGENVDTGAGLYSNGIKAGNWASRKRRLPRQL